MVNEVKQEEEVEMERDHERKVVKVRAVVPRNKP